MDCTNPWVWAVVVELINKQEMIPEPVFGGTGCADQQVDNKLTARVLRPPVLTGLQTHNNPTGRALRRETQ